MNVDVIVSVRQQKKPSPKRYLQHPLVVGLVRQRGLDRGLGHRKGAPGLGNRWAVVGQPDHGSVAAPWVGGRTGDRGRRIAKARKANHKKKK